MTDFSRWLKRQKQLNAGGSLAINQAGTPISAPESDGGGVTVSDGTTEEIVEKIIAPGADLSTPGEATLVASGEQTVSLIGPFPIAWNDVGIEDVPGLKVADLAAGAIVLKLMVIRTAAWTTLVNAYIQFWLAAADGSPRLGIEAFDINLGVETASGGGMTLRRTSRQSVENGTFDTSVFEDSGGAMSLFVQLSYDSGTADAGSAIVYALVAEPSA